jgi:thiopurine S-methyltransferase
VQPEFWHERWRLAQTAFHQSSVERHLMKFWPMVAPSSNHPVFIPLCGKSLDMLWLRELGHQVIGVEISAVALESFLMEHGIAARRRLLIDFDRYEPDQMELWCGDFYALASNQLGAVKLVYDRAALIAWAPALRSSYVHHMTQLTSQGTQTLLITLEYDQDQMRGPPFSVNADVVDRLYGANHEIRMLARVDILANEPRLQARGLTALHEVCYHLTRV